MGVLLFGGRWRNELIICGVIAALFVVIWPVGEYPVNDDWAYVKSLEHLHFDRRLKILEWNPMSLVGHLFWGLAFTKLFGFSFTVAVAHQLGPRAAQDRLTATRRGARRSKWIIVDERNALPCGSRLNCVGLAGA